MNQIDLYGRLRDVAFMAHFSQGLFGWLCLMNVTQLVQFYLYTAITHNNATYRQKRAAGWNDPVCGSLL
ncbi:hypothetical protein [Mitsuokella multacida]|uniref:hypothetical protein n=1 Tax=Mitsuokella multacida TaxID=52226 RepID=UPI003FA225E3